MKETFDCVILSRADLEDKGFDTSGISDDQMERFASKVGDALVGEYYWDIIESMAELWDLPRKPRGKNDKNNKCKKQ